MMMNVECGCVLALAGRAAARTADPASASAMRMRFILLLVDSEDNRSGVAGGGRQGILQPCHGPAAVVLHDSHDFLEAVKTDREMLPLEQVLGGQDPVRRLHGRGELDRGSVSSRGETDDRRSGGSGGYRSEHACDVPEVHGFP